MTSKIILTALATLCLSMGSASYAQNFDPYRDNGDHTPFNSPNANRGNNQRNDRSVTENQNRGANQRNDRDNYQGRNDRNNYQGRYDGNNYQGRYDGNRQYEQRGAGPGHDWRRGSRLPNEYRNRQYVVDDWRGHHLSQPPRGYHWVQAGNDYVLAAIATGVILQLMLGN